MINTELLKIHMNRNGIQSFEELAAEIGHDVEDVNEWIQERDAPTSFAEDAARRLGIPLDQWKAVFFSRPTPQLSVASEYSLSIPELDENEILANYDPESLSGAYNTIDALLIAWQMTRSYPGEYPESLKEAIEDAKPSISGAYAEEVVTAIEDAATMHGFALGVQFALAASAKDGAIWAMLRPERKAAKQ